MTDIKLVSLTDLEQLQAISEATFREAFSKLNSEKDMDRYLKENFSLAKLRTELKTPGSVFFLAQVEGSPAGYLKLNTGRAQSEPGHDRGLEIQRIYVLKDHKGRGIGSALMAKAIQRARQQGLDYIWLGVWERNHSAIGFYKAHGFVQFGTHDFLLGDDRQTDHLMKKTIRTEAD